MKTVSKRWLLTLTPVVKSYHDNKQSSRDSKRQKISEEDEEDSKRNTQKGKSTFK